MRVELVTIYSSRIIEIPCTAVLVQDDYLECYFNDVLDYAYPLRDIVTFRVLNG